MNKIKLTENQLQQIIKEAVDNILKEEMVEEGPLDFIKSFGGQYGKRAGAAMKQGYDNAKNAVSNAYNNTRDAVSNAYNNVKNDIQQTAQRAHQDSSMKDMQKAFANFKSAVEKFESNGGTTNRQLKSWIRGIENMMSRYNPNF